MKDFIDEHNHPMAEPDVACLLRASRLLCFEKVDKGGQECISSYKEEHHV